MCWSTANVAYLGGYETSRRWGLPEGLGHSPLSTLTSHSHCSREKPVPRDASTAMTDCFPQNITQINPFSTLSSFCRNPVSNEEGKWYKATHFALLASNCCMKMDPPASASQAYGTTAYVSTPSKNHHVSLSYFFNCMCMLRMFVCVCVRARALVAINPRLHSSHLLSYIFNCVCMFVYLYVCLSVYSGRDKPRASCM